MEPYKIGETVAAAGKTFRLISLLGHGKGGYSYLAECEDGHVVLKRIHHEPCDYYRFGNKIEAEIRDYQRLLETGIRMPKMLAADPEQEIIIKEYIPGKTAFACVCDGTDMDPMIIQVKEMAEKARSSGINIDYFPTNFIVHEGLIWYIDFECNDYMEEWNFENWGSRYWNDTPDFRAYLRQHPEML